MTDFKMKQFGAHSGVMIVGKGQVLDYNGFDVHSHIDRSLLLALAVEGPKWGTIQTYDGAGVSAGLLHHIAAFPQNKTLGSFWPLYFACAAAVPELALPGIRPDARMRPVFDGKVMDGDAVRLYFTGTERGVTKSLTPELKERCLRVSELFAHPKTFKLQADAGRTWIWKTTGRYPVELFMPRGVAPKASSPAGTLRDSDFPSPAIELAFCVLRACAVNNPKDAGDAMRDALVGDQHEFAKRIYSELREERKNWVVRIERLARAATTLKLWPKEATDLMLAVPTSV